MNKEIKYSGVSLHTSDYDAPDGQLSLSINLIPDKSGSLVPILPPAPILENIAYPPVAVHKVANQTNLLCFDKGRKLLFFIPVENPDAGYTSVTSSASVPEIAILGNTLFISDGVTSSYALWSPERGSYISLGSSIPELDIDFALGHATLTDESFSSLFNIPIPEGLSGDMVNKIFSSLSGGSLTVPPRTNADAFIGNLSDAVLGFINKSVAQTHEEGKFIFPFMLRWALRLFDGSYIHQSAPILMIPNSNTPPVSYKATTKDGMIEMSATFPARRCTLMFNANSLSALSLWKDVVKSIDIFVSAPIYTYDQSGSVSIFHRDFLRSFSFSGEKYTVTSDGGSSLPGPNDDGHRRPVSPTTDSNTFYHFPNGNAEAWLKLTVSSSGESIPGRVVTGRPEGYDPVPAAPLLNPASLSQKEIEDKISAVSSFYLISSIQLSDIKTGQDGMSGFIPVDIQDSALSNIVVRPRLSDDWRSHDDILFKSAYTYNSRVILSGVSSLLFKGFSVSSMSQYRQSPDGNEPSQYTVWVKTVRNSSTVWVSAPSKLSDDWLPRFLFYPDPNAVEMRVVCNDGSGGWQLPLKSHDFLNGAFWFDGLGAERTQKDTEVTAPDISGQKESALIIPEPQKIFVSEVNNPFLFPLLGRVTVGSGEVLATCAAVRALSQGQFGSHPLYAFTSEGVWALSVASDGTFSAVQPVTRDVCTSTASITQIDSGVLFATSRGIMLLSGASSQCISTPIDSQHPFPFSDLPSYDSILDVAGRTLEDVSTPPFLSFIDNVRMAFDYTNQRIHLFNPLYPVAYVYSLESKQWGMEWSDFETPLNSYPDSWVIDKDRNLLNLASSDSENVSAILLTRPLSLGSPDLLKTIRTIIQRGFFKSGEIKSALFASRDLLNWHLVGSSVSHRLSNFSGTPFKTFRILLLATLSPSRSISGASIAYSPRLTNRFR